jgi:hypothetical protein
MSNNFSWQSVLNTWDVKQEQGKADFLEFLYDLYKPTDHTYTGIWQRFQKDYAESFRNCFISGTALPELPFISKRNK